MSSYNINQPTINRILYISPYLEKMRNYFRIGTDQDILDGVDSDMEDNDLTQDQVIERKKRQKCSKRLMEAFYDLPPIETFKPEQYFNDILFERTERSIDPYLEKMRDYLLIGKSGDKFEGCYGIKHELLNEEQLKELQKRQTYGTYLIQKFRSGEIPPIEEFNPSTFFSPI